MQLSHPFFIIHAGSACHASQERLSLTQLRCKAWLLSPPCGNSASTAQHGVNALANGCQVCSHLSLLLLWQFLDAPITVYFDAAAICTAATLLVSGTLSRRWQTMRLEHSLLVKAANCSFPNTCITDCHLKGLLLSKCCIQGCCWVPG